MRRIPLYGRDHRVTGHALVDADVYDELAGFNWHLGTTGYAQRSRSTAERDQGRPHREMMHRQIMALPPRDARVVDHINGDRLDNRRENLRVGTPAENAQNRGASRSARYSQLRGVSWHKRNRCWVAMVKLNGRLHNLGSFASEEEAGRAAAAFRAEHMPFSADAREAA